MLDTVCKEHTISRSEENNHIFSQVQCSRTSAKNSKGFLGRSTSTLATTSSRYSSHTFAMYAFISSFFSVDSMSLLEWNRFGRRFFPPKPVGLDCHPPHERVEKFDGEGKEEEEREAE